MQGPQKVPKVEGDKFPATAHTIAREDRCVTERFAKLGDHLVDLVGSYQRILVPFLAKPYIRVAGVNFRHMWVLFMDDREEAHAMGTEELFGFMRMVSLKHLGDHLYYVVRMIHGQNIVF